MELLGTSGTAAYIRDLGLDCDSVNKVRDGSPHCVDAIRAGRVAAVINTVGTPESVHESFSIRRAALECGIPYFTTAAAAEAASEGVELLDGSPPGVNALQDLHSRNA
jgi:carbamoyl-phosphate synthase large subunit